MPVPDDKTLAAYTETVYKNCPYSDKLLTDAPYPEKTAIPTRVGEPSPIKYVLYIIKENRTYDQVFGDLNRGNGDPSLVMFGRDVTPNHHKLAEEFVLLDNLYCNGHVSADGHPWSTMAYNTDYIARNWALTYSGRAGVQDDDDGDLSNAPSGYLWDACAQGRASRIAATGNTGGASASRMARSEIEGAVPGLVGHMSPGFGAPRPGGGRTRDPERAETFIRELAEFEKNNNLPRFMVMSLGEDHTTGTRPGTYTPRACVASNDVALGRIVEAISRSKYLARDRDLRHRGRRPEWTGPRRCPSHGRPGNQPLHQAEAPGQHPVQHRQHDPHDRVDPGPARRSRSSTQPRARCSPRSRASADLSPYSPEPPRIESERGECADSLRRRSARSRWISTSTTGSMTSS